LEKADAVCLPTIGRIYQLDEIAAEPVRFNSNLGFYTNFFNLLDLCGLAIPFGKRVDGLPFGITYAAPAWNDLRLLAHAAGRTVPPTSGFATMELGVFGAHMRGQPLEHRLLALGGKFLCQAKTAPVYRMVALDAMRPGVFRVKEGGASLELEIWELPRAAFGELLAEIPAPLGLGRVLLENETEVCGFLCEPAAAAHKPDITHCGGWRNRPQIDVS
jgi:allophanate hydrolase